MSDTPTLPFPPNGINSLSLTFTLQVAVSVAGQGVLSDDKGTYWSEVTGNWLLNLSGAINGGVWTPDLLPAQEVRITSPFAVSAPTKMTIPVGPILNVLLNP
jgi:hypothetical protein